MDGNAIAELEDTLFEIKKKPETAAQTVGDIIGVLIGLKPAMIGGFEEYELDNSKIKEFDETLNELGLEKVYFENSYLLGDKKMTVKSFCISKKMSLAEQTQKAFTTLWATMDEKGTILDREKWVEATREIGELLGYPKTATEEFIKEDDLDNKDRVERMKRNRYYIHSAKHEDEEFAAYDQKLNKAISELAPKTTNVLTSKKEKRWLA